MEEQKRAEVIQRVFRGEMTRGEAALAEIIPVRVEESRPPGLSSKGHWRELLRPAKLFGREGRVLQLCNPCNFAIQAPMLPLT